MEKEPNNRKIRIDDNGNLVTTNLSAYWIPELTVAEEIHGKKSFREVGE